ncbi:uncharacterized protein BDV17DRAFT_287948 [Aspergillus undulatus]|uniref:uncharacterized protein n=1 Tax=Aspergillus undulatus TaxID=1810928 RepID=UPI003CCC9C33
MNYEVRIWYRPTDGTWRFAAILFDQTVNTSTEAQTEVETETEPEPQLNAPTPATLRDVEDLFNSHVNGPTSWLMWVDKIRDCDDLIPGWEEWEMPAGKGGLQCQTRLAWDDLLGETY